MARDDSRLHVLLVEDDPDMARLVSCQLGWSGAARFTVDHAPDLQTALGRIERDAFDAVLFDLSLPDGDPMSTLVVAGTLARQLPVLVLTAIEDEAIADLAARIGAQAYLVKGRGLDARRLGARSPRRSTATAGCRPREPAAPSSAARGRTICLEVPVRERPR